MWSIVDAKSQLSEILRRARAGVGRILTDTDSIMAATAVVKSAALVTRNVKDFEKLKIEIINPFAVTSA